MSQSLVPEFEHSTLCYPTPLYNRGVMVCGETDRSGWGEMRQRRCLLLVLWSLTPHRPPFTPSLILSPPHASSLSQLRPPVVNLILCCPSSCRSIRSPDKIDFTRGSHTQNQKGNVHMTVLPGPAFLDVTSPDRGVRRLTSPTCFASFCRPPAPIVKGGRFEPGSAQVTLGPDRKVTTLRPDQATVLYRVWASPGKEWGLWVISCQYKFY